MPWINHLPPVCWSTFGILVWNDSGYVNLTQWWYFFIIFEYILHISTPHIMIFCFPLPYFPLSQQVLYFLLSTLVLTLYIDVVLSLSILWELLIWWSSPSFIKIKAVLGCLLGRPTIDPGVLHQRELVEEHQARDWCGPWIVQRSYVNNVHLSLKSVCWGMQSKGSRLSAWNVI